MTNFKNMIDTKMAAQLLGLTPGTVKNLCAAGKINCRKFGNSWILDMTDLSIKGDVEGFVSEAKTLDDKFEEYIQFFILHRRSHLRDEEETQELVSKLRKINAKS